MASSFLLWIWAIIAFAFLQGCTDEPWNDPYPKSSVTQHTLYSAFTEQPKTLDPARS